MYLFVCLYIYIYIYNSTCSHSWGFHMPRSDLLQISPPRPHWRMSSSQVLRYPAMKHGNKKSPINRALNGNIWEHRLYMGGSLVPCLIFRMYLYV